MPSFDIVSEVEVSEIRNACENANRELATRFDFRNVEAEFELGEELIKMTAEADFQLQQMLDILRNNLVKRKIDTRSIDLADVEHRGKLFSQVVSFKVGIDQPTAKKLVKLIKESKIKVQTAIQGDQLRVTGKKRDDLQQVMALVRESDMEQPFQFNNFRD
ncbi:MULTISPECIES: YajQ family cyclic di-GMP-binding protein [Aliagarivorans]|uniref:YajQ family cyclic di-GMP-binding protein n=1 Tax=Aliagarivorans TaxID=882379 RepID=UPI000404EA88|nr:MULTISPECIES: YajQ family cyclic di-GMP-binding protein [Aliagarivorans]